MVLIHVFRMPGFYAMAGCSRRFLQRYGLRRAAWNDSWHRRSLRGEGWIIVYPLSPIFLMVWASRSF